MSKTSRYRILVAVKDYLNFKALAQLLEYFHGDAEIIFLHVIEFPQSTSLYPETVTQYIEDARKKFRSLVEWANSQGVSAELRVVASRNVVESVLSEAERIDADLILLQKTLKKIERRIRRLIRQTNLEKIAEVSKKIVVLLPPD